MGYGEFLYPGIVLMLLLFAAIFSTITLIEDRTAGFLRGGFGGAGFKAEYCGWKDCGGHGDRTVAGFYLL